MATTSVVIPVKDGARWLARGARAPSRARRPTRCSSSTRARPTTRSRSRAPPGVDACSRSRPRSSATAARATSRSSTRAASSIAFLTQDATPVPGWLAAYREAFALDERVAAAFGPHLAAPGHEPDDRPRADGVLRRVQPRRRAGAPARRSTTESWHPGFLSNANAAYRRAALEAIRFRDVALRRGPGVRARPVRRRAAARPTTPAPPCCTPTTTRGREFMRRYFDEYRGLRETTGHVERHRRALDARASCATRSPRDRAFLDAQGVGGAASARRWTARSAAHHGGRRVFSALGSRADRLPAGRAARAVARGARRRRRRRRRRRGPSGDVAPRPPRASVYAEIARLRGATAPRRCCRPVPGIGERDAAARRDRDPAVPQRQRRPRHDLPRLQRARAARPHVLGLARRPARRT